MSSDPVISLRGVGKAYRLFQRRADRMKQILFRRWGRSYGTEFWALKDVSFDVRKGESIGIIGRNGSGKSTLLQVVAGILRPTTGSLAVQGRVAALLELGSGFNPEFTGRENVYLNAALFGMTRREMTERFDEVANFAGIGAYIDQPVKFYSSGMALRLAFSVQIVVPKEVLIVDEALAVGDEAFQRKCMRAIEHFRETGGTALYVSHNVRSVANACGRCLLLVDGNVIADGKPKPVIDLYQKLLYSSPSERDRVLADALDQCPQGAGNSPVPEGSTTLEVDPAIDKPAGERGKVGKAVDWLDESLTSPEEIEYGSGGARITSVGLYDTHDQPVNVLTCGAPYELRYIVDFSRSVASAGFGMAITTPDGIQVANDFSGWHIPPDRETPARARIEVRFLLHMNLAPGTYYVTVGLNSSEGTDVVIVNRRVDVLTFRMVEPRGPSYGGIVYLGSKCVIRAAVSAHSNGSRFPATG